MSAPFPLHACSCTPRLPPQSRCSYFPSGSGSCLPGSPPLCHCHDIVLLLLVCYHGGGLWRPGKAGPVYFMVPKGGTGLQSWTCRCACPWHLWHPLPTLCPCSSFPWLAALPAVLCANTRGPQLPFPHGICPLLPFASAGRSLFQWGASGRPRSLGIRCPTCLTVSEGPGERGQQQRRTQGLSCESQASSVFQQVMSSAQGDTHPLKLGPAR